MKPHDVQNSRIKCAYWVVDVNFFSINKAIGAAQGAQAMTWVVFTSHHFESIAHALFQVL